MPCIVIGRALDPGCPALIRSDIWGTRSAHSPSLSHGFTLVLPLALVPALVLSPAASPHLSVGVTAVPLWGPARKLISVCVQTRW